MILRMKGAILFLLVCTPALGDLAAGRRAYHEGDHAKDETLFTDFGNIAERMCEDEARTRNMTRAEIEPAQSDLKDFLEGEAELRP